MRSLHLFLVRHGQSEGNLGVHKTDPDLTELGKRQAELIARRLVSQEIEILLCSPLRRSLQTARVISKEVGAKPVVWPELMESWDGSEATPATDISFQFPDFAVDIPERWWPKNEDEGDLYERAARAEKRIRSLGEETNRRVAAVSHGTFGAVLISVFLGAPPCGYTRFSQHNCCISILDIRPKRAKLYQGNDVSHLPPELLT